MLLLSGLCNDSHTSWLVELDFQFHIMIQLRYFAFKLKINKSNFPTESFSILNGEMIRSPECITGDLASQVDQTQVIVFNIQ
jgi:hypothetical protein